MFFFSIKKNVIYLLASVWWYCLYVQNPNYMKENFSIVIESYHIADNGTQENVSELAVLKIIY